MNISPGVYYGMSNQEYHAAPALSRSRLMDFAKGFEHYEYVITHIQEPTDEMMLGTAFHEAVLQPELNRAVPFDGRRSGNEWKEFQKKNEGKIILPQKNYDIMTAMVEAVYAHPKASSILRTEPSFREVSIFWKDEQTGTPLKARLDFLVSEDGEFSGFITDLKTTAGGGADRDEFCKTVEKKFGYDIQAWMNLEAARHEFGNVTDFMWIVVEKEPPYRVEVYEECEDHIEGGRIKFYNRLAQFLEYQRDPEAYRSEHKIIKRLEASKWYGKDFE